MAARLGIFPGRDALGQYARFSETEDHINHHDQGERQYRVDPKGDDLENAQDGRGVELIRDGGENENVMIFKPGRRLDQRLLYAVQVFPDPIRNLPSFPNDQQQ